MSIIIANETMSAHKSLVGMVNAMAIATKPQSQHNPKAN
jgi:hypothetical protein